MKISKKFKIIGLFALISTVIFFNNMLNQKTKFNNRILKIWSSRIPYSTDPLDYDSLAHHICLRSVYSSLVSDYKVGEIRGIIAKNWTTNSNRDSWVFEIRENLFFADGTPITPQSVALSINRATYIFNKKNSQAGLLEYIIGNNEISSASNLAKGISFTKNSIVLSFTKSIPDLIDRISFGLYGIVSPSDYDKNTGAWFNKKKINSSGPYDIYDWKEQNLILKLKDNYPKNLLLENPIKEVLFDFNPQNIQNSDLVIDFDDSLALSKEYNFHGAIKSAIRYVSCESWQTNNSICNNKTNRVALRNLFYNELDKIGFKTIKSFFPLAIKNISPFSLNLDKKNFDLSVLQGKNLSISLIAKAYKSFDHENDLTPQEAYSKSIRNISTRYKIKLSEETSNIDPSLSKKVDLKFRMTAILVDSPINDINFMFFSDRGIKLPDETGKIKQYIKDNTNISVQKINEMMWDQALIWPINHMALGLWTKNNNINLDTYNLLLPPLDLQWIQWR